jgi:hypothetical protein
VLALPAGDSDIIGHVFWAMPHGALMLNFAGKPEGNFRAVLSETFRAPTAGFRPYPAAN